MGITICTPIQQKHYTALSPHRSFGCINPLSRWQEIRSGHGLLHVGQCSVLSGSGVECKVQTVIIISCCWCL